VICRFTDASAAVMATKPTLSSGPMDTAIWGFVGVVVGSLITAIVTIGGELLRGRHESLLDTKKRQDDRHIESDRIQRETLLELQDRLTDWMQDRPVWNPDESSYRKRRGTSGIDKEMEQFAERSVLAGRSLARLTQRVLDDDLREALLELQTLSGEAVFAKDREELKDIWFKTTFAELRVQVKLGHVLRTYLQPSDAR
jgi:hypothetical protein